MMNTRMIPPLLALLGVMAFADLASAGPPGFGAGYPFAYPNYAGAPRCCNPPPPRYCPPPYFHYHRPHWGVPPYPAYGPPFYRPAFPVYGFPGYSSGLSFGFTLVR
jgi:hypothetical protein